MNVFFFFQFALVHYYTKVGGGEYYLEDLEETNCLYEIKKKILMERKLEKRLKEMEAKEVKYFFFIINPSREKKSFFFCTDHYFGQALALLCGRSGGP